MNKKKHRICFVETIYTLFLYLLSCTEEDIHDTLFVTNGVMKDINLEFLDADAGWKKYKRLYLFLCKFYLGFIIDKFVRRQILSKATSNAPMFAQDHLFNSYQFIGRRKYIWIEDSQNFLASIASPGNPYFEFFLKRRYPCKNIKYFIRLLLFGNVVSGMYAHNKNCVSLLLSRDDRNPSTLHLPRKIVDFKQAWDSSTPQKKKLILSIFKVDELQLKRINQFPVILFTQNLFYIKGITREDQVELYKKIIDKYGVSNVLVKTHPFDNIPYEQYIPSIHLLRENIPSQLLGLLGMKDKILATIYSTSVFSMDYKRVDWYLEGLPEKIKAKMPSVTLPIPVNHCNV